MLRCFVLYSSVQCASPLYHVRSLSGETLLICGPNDLDHLNQLNQEHVVSINRPCGNFPIHDGV